MEGAIRFCVRNPLITLIVLAVLVGGRTVGRSAPGLVHREVLGAPGYPLQQKRCLGVVRSLAARQPLLDVRRIKHPVETPHPGDRSGGSARNFGDHLNLLGRLEMQRFLALLHELADSVVGGGLRQLRDVPGDHRALLDGQVTEPSMTL